jgi:hypothetical protein
MPGPWRETGHKARMPGVKCVTICYKKFLGFQQLVQKHWTLENQRMVEEQQIAQAQEQGLIK